VQACRLILYGTQTLIQSIVYVIEVKWSGYDMHEVVCNSTAIKI